MGPVKFDRAKFYCIISPVTKLRAKGAMMFAVYAHAILLEPSGSLTKMKGSFYYLYFEATVTKRLKLDGSKAFQRLFRSGSL